MYAASSMAHIRLSRNRNCQSSVRSGSTARTHGPGPRRGVEREPAAERLDAIGEAAQAGAVALARVGAAAAVVGDLHAQLAVVGVHAHPQLARVARA